MNNNKFKKILFGFIVLAAVVFVLFLFSETTLGQRLDFFELPAAIRERIILLFGLETNHSANPDDTIQLLLINEKTYRPGVNNIGDIVGVFDGTHEFSPAEIEAFDIVRIKGINREQAEAALEKLLPDTSGMAPEQIDQSYTSPKYKFRIIDKTQKTLDKAVKMNIKLKSQ